MYASQCFDSALRALCSTQRGLLVHVGRPHERGALRGERLQQPLEGLVGQPDGAIARRLPLALGHAPAQARGLERWTSQSTAL